MRVWLVVAHEPYGGGAHSWHVFATRSLADAFADGCPEEYGDLDREWIDVEEHEVRTSLEEF